MGALDSESGDAEVSWLGVIAVGAFPASVGGQWQMPRARRLQLRGQRRS